MVEEDTTYDSEMRHTKEKVSWLAIEGDGTLEATAIGVGYLPNGSSKGYVRAEGWLSSFGWLGSVIQSLPSLWSGLVSSSGLPQGEEPTLTPIATPSLTPAVSTATPIPATGTATLTAIPTSRPTPTLEPTLLDSSLDNEMLSQAESFTFGVESHKLIEQEDTIASLGWSPDGNWIAFDQTNDLYIVSVYGGEPILLLRSNNAALSFWLSLY